MSEIINVTVNPTGPVIDAVVQGGGVGPVGPAGSPGSAGASVNLQVAGGYIQWQHVGDSSWNNLIAVSSLVGATGATGATGAVGSNGSSGAAGASVNLQVSGGYIQWQHVGDSSWTNLIAVSSLVGATGATGSTGAAGSDASVTSENIESALGYTPVNPSSDPDFGNGISVGSQNLTIDIGGNLGTNGYVGASGGLYTNNSSLNPDGSASFAEGSATISNIGQAGFKNSLAIASIDSGSSVSIGASGSDAGFAIQSDGYGNIEFGTDNYNLQSNISSNYALGISSPNFSIGHDGSASFADGSAGFDASGNLHATNYNGLANLFPLGSSAYADGGTGANPARYIIQDQSTNVIGYVNLSWDGSPLVLIGIQATDASGNPLTHGTFAMYYDSSGNLTSVVCSN